MTYEPRVRAEQLRVYPIFDLRRGVSHDASVFCSWLSNAVSGGATAIQLRDKRSGRAELVALAQALRSLRAREHVVWVINDDLDVALEVKADGVHLGQTDMSVQQARAQAQRRGRGDLFIGLSVSTVTQARAGARAGADYLSVSPLFGTATKTDLARPAGVDGLRAIRAACRDLPLVVIGGVRPAHVPQIIASGADGVSFVSAASSNTETQVREFASAMTQAWTMKGTARAAGSA